MTRDQEKLEQVQQNNQANLTNSRWVKPQLIELVDQNVSGKNVASIETFFDITGPS